MVGKKAGGKWIRFWVDGVFLFDFGDIGKRSFVKQKKMIYKSPCGLMLHPANTPHGVSIPRFSHTDNKESAFMPSPSHAADPSSPASGGSSTSFDPGAATIPFFSAADWDGTAVQEQCWVVLGDVHGDVSQISRIPELANADGVIITGDLTKLGGIAQARSVIEAVQALNPVVLAQIGNMDGPEVNDWLEKQGINLHRKVRELSPDVAIMGVGGSTFTPFGTPSEFPEARFAEWLDSLAKRAHAHKIIVLVTHNPPHDTVCDRTGSGDHVGSRAVREFIEEHQPDVCLCGHIHESRGEQLIGRTMVVNPGVFAAGGYALLRLTDRIGVSLCRLEA